VSARAFSLGAAAKRRAQKMWTTARKKIVSGLPTLSNALKFTGAMLAFDLLWFNVKGRDSAPWIGDIKQKTWSSEFDKKDPTKRYETYYRSDPERPHLRYPVGVVRFTREAHPRSSRFQPIDSGETDAPGGENATWDPWSPSL
jgi:hypothetical protein